MSTTEPTYQSRAIFGAIPWRDLPSQDWAHLHFPGHLVDQVFRILVARATPARFFEITVSEQCPKDAYSHLARGLRRLNHEMVVVNVIHARSGGGHLIFWRRGSTVTYHHLDLSLIKPGALDQEVVKCLKKPTPSHLETMFRLLDGRQIHENLFQTLRGHLNRLPAQDDAGWTALVDLVLKLVFLIFVQRKGWLNFDHAYLGTKMRACQGRSLSILHCLLKPLFARLEGFREREPVPLGVLPRLSGGLFRFQVNALPKIENDWCMTLYETLISQFSFSLFEAREDRKIVGVSPEVLGHVFENLLRGKHRKHQGVFYTPAPIAEKQVNEAFRLALGPVANQDVAVLRKMRVLDPSCGSGTYLVAAFQALLKARLTLAPVHERYNGKLYALKRQIVLENLYGVDINPMAVRLTEVRLWLNMIQDLEIAHPEEAPPLPNLQHHLRPGDFLARFEPKHETRVGEWPGHGRLKRLREKFPMSPPGHRPVLLRHIYRMESELFNFLVAREAEDRREVVHTFLRQQPLPGFDRSLPELDKKRMDCGVMLHAVFSDVMPAGGFDLVVGNPPWLRGAAIPRAQKRRFRKADLLPEGLKLNGHADLSLYFLGAVLKLVKPGGHLGFLLPGKLMQARYARDLRGYLARRYRIDYLHDYGIDHQFLFKADTFPLALGLTNRPPTPEHRVSIERFAKDIHLTHSVHQADLSDTSGTWVLDQEKRGRNRDWPRLKQGFLKIQKGVMTNAKHHFVFDKPPSFLPATHLRRLLRGRDIQVNGVAPEAWIYWPFDDGPLWHRSLQPAERQWLLETGKYKTAKGALSYKPRVIGPWLVAWKYLAAHWQAALICNQGWVPDQTTYYIEFADFEAAYRYFVYINSHEANTQMARLAERGKSRCYFFYAHTCGELALPPDLMTRHLSIPQPEPVFPPGVGQRASALAGWSPLPN